MKWQPPGSTLFPYTTLFRSLPRHFSELRRLAARLADAAITNEVPRLELTRLPETAHLLADTRFLVACAAVPRGQALFRWQERSEEHTSELQSPAHIVCRFLL